MCTLTHTRRGPLWKIIGVTLGEFIANAIGEFVIQSANRRILFHLRNRLFAGISTHFTSLNAFVWLYVYYFIYFFLFFYLACVKWCVWHKHLEAIFSFCYFYLFMLFVSFECSSLLILYVAG